MLSSCADWSRPSVTRALYNIGCDWVMDVEHDDCNRERCVEKVRQGFLLAKKYLESFTV